MTIKSVAVFCGSKNGNNPIYVQHAIEVARMLAQQKITVVYGGGNKGLMGTVANTVLQFGGRIIGVMPKVLMDWEHQHIGLTELHEVADMHVRKTMLFEKCDAAIILAGGYGTLDELFEMLTWNQLSIHDKHIIVLNSAGFYNHLIAHMGKMEEEGFLYHGLMNKIRIIQEPSQLKID
ncbi:MAG: TIGR00730 family Rossman fold protein [Ginsengibacter sp.]